MKWATSGTQRVALVLFQVYLLAAVWPESTAELTDGGAYRGRGGEDAGVFLNAFAVKLRGREERDVAEKIASEHGFRFKAELPHSEVFIFEHPDISGRTKRSVDGQIDSLLADPRVAHAQQEVLLHRVKRRILYDKQLELPIREIVDNSVFKRYDPPASLYRRDNMDGGEGQGGLAFKDPLYKDMWYLNNQGQSGGENGLDMNVGVAWEKGFTGKGVVVCILDDGVDHTHPDLIDNYDPKASTDLNDKYDFRDDPMPDTSDTYNSHGTRCAGEIAAAANNDVCGVGVAYEARIGGVRVLDGPISDSLEAEAISFNRDYIDIYSASWGPSDDGSTMEGPRHLTLDALAKGVTKGRKGLGSIYVWATGNGGMYGDDCSADGYVSRPETLSVGSVNDWGRSPFFMENCSSTLAVVPSGGEDYKGQEEENDEIKLKVITTDFKGKCIENFQGTSSAAPLAAGCMANVLQANPTLTWRDVQHIVIQGSRIPSVDRSWTINGAGRHVSHRFGFGLMDCGRMVGLAQTWEPVPEQRVCNTTKQSFKPLMYQGSVSDVIMSDGCMSNNDHGSSGPGAIDRLEHVQVYIKMATDLRGDTAIYLISPAGTRSVLLSPRPRDAYEGEWEFTFMTVHSWDESPRGKWTLEVHHRPGNGASSEKSSGRTKPTTKVDLLKQKLNEELAKEGHKASTSETVGYVKEWSLVLHGTHGTRHGRTSLLRSRTQEAYRPSTDDVAEIKKREVELSSQVKVAPALHKDTTGDKRGADTSLVKDSPGGTGDKAGELAEMVWELLHAHGAKDVRKRVLQDADEPRPTQSYTHSNTNNKRNKLKRQHSQQWTDKLDELIRLTEGLIKRLPTREN